jgi:protein SCO1/2
MSISVRASVTVRAPVLFALALFGADSFYAPRRAAAFPEGDGLPMRSLSLSVGPRPLPTAREAPNLVSGVGITQKLDGTVPLDAVFRDEEGKESPLSAYFGSRPLIIVPAYYRCPILCSQVLEGLAGSLKGMSLNAGTDFQVVALSFNPAETPAAAAEEKRRVARRYHRPGSEHGWHFLTGREPEIARVMQAIGYRYSYDARTQQYMHPAGFVILTPAGRISRYFAGLDVAPRDLRLSLVEASEGKIGTPLDQLLLYCYRYDPRASKYGARILSFLQLGGALTLFGLLVLLLTLRSRDTGRSRWERTP